jgi:sugar lactone lactonase YvrE
VDLGTGESWRHLDGLLWVHGDPLFYLSIWGETVYTYPSPGSISSFQVGTDGITLSADGETLYWTAVTNRYLYSVPTARLRDHTSPTAQILSAAATTRLTQKGVGDGLESDSNGYVYGGSFETNAINVYFPGNGTVATFVRDPRLDWTDTMSVVTLGDSSTSSGGGQGYLYFTKNQLWRLPSFQGGVDRRVKPYGLFRVPLPDGGGKIQLM